MISSRSGRKDLTEILLKGDVGMSLHEKERNKKMLGESISLDIQNVSKEWVHSRTSDNVH